MNMRSYKDLNINYLVGDIDISNKGITSLVGCPQHINGYFICNHNNLTSLIDGPQRIDGGFSCYCSGLTNLVGCASHIGGPIDFSHNKLTSLVGGPQTTGGDYECQANQLTDLAGCSSHISGTLNFLFNDITSLVGIHKIIKSCGQITFNDYKITNGGIGLLLIENLIKFSCYHEPFEIIASYIGKGTKGMMECSKELISKGFDDYAKL